MSVDYTCKMIPILGVVSLLPVPVHLLISVASKQLKRMNNHLCYLTDNINILKVELT